MPSFIEFAILGVVVFGGLALIIFAAHRTPILKDQLVPQIEPRYQTYSLAKTQMAFWFLVILGSTLYIFIFRGATLHDSVITPTALSLLGIGVLTAGASTIVDRIRDTPEDRLNAALQAVGISCHQDVKDIEKEVDDLGTRITALKKQVSAPGQPKTHLPAQPQAKGAPPTQDEILQSKRNDLLVKLRYHASRTADFQSQGFLPDLINNISGTGLHRLQALVWTALIGIEFVWEVHQGTSVTLPAIDPNLLTLMGISSAGYVGFKYNETNY
jgi:hypothetical protein